MNIQYYSKKSRTYQSLPSHTSHARELGTSCRSAWETRSSWSRRCRRARVAHLETAAARDAHLLHLPRLLRHEAAGEEVGVRKLADGAPEHGLALGGGLPPVPQSTRNPDLTSDVAEGVLEVGHQDGCDGAAQRQRPGRHRLPPWRHPARSSWRRQKDVFTTTSR